MIVTPKVRGFICTTAHPIGCAVNVSRQIEYVRKNQTFSGPKRVLVIGASTGYGLASRIVASFGMGAKTIGVFFEKEASNNKTASPGWYNSAAFERAALQAKIYAKSINGDAFSDQIKQEAIDLIKQDWDGKVDLIIYSLASPRRIDPHTGAIYNSVLKPIGQTYTNKSLNVLNKEVTEVSIEPASDDEINNTVKVMGGEDWTLWIEALQAAGVLAEGATTVAYSYIGPEITYSIYRNGTIGKAKEHLEETAHKLNNVLQSCCHGQAFVAVNKGLVTQASSAIPVVPLYMSLLYRVMKDNNNHEGCIEQIYRLFADRLYKKQSGCGCCCNAVTENKICIDEKRRIRIDDWELLPEIQAEVLRRWNKVSTSNLEQLADLEGYRKDFYNLFGFDVDGVNYEGDIDIEVSIPSLQEVEA
jgi:enoyl-[acyl-carrier protein] reductase/trans-2-enoyl-CoA reductase (NAD+)